MRIILRINPYPWGQLPPESQGRVRELVSDVWIDSFTPPDGAMFMNMTPLDNAIMNAVEREFDMAIPIGAISDEYPAVLSDAIVGDDD